MDDPRYAFDLHALFAQTLLQLLHQASPFSMENDILHIEHKYVWASVFRSTATTLATILVSFQWGEM